ncbi:MAG: GntR family transcriptional regulator [Treponema sp.]|jgi:DNA-binding GntR family transcriptional regulator|nr:GntR family transcriptional regulator [Treponema sp.]
MAPNVSVLTDYAYSEILRMILSADIQAGTRIREDLLAEQLGISRTPVREAVNRLTQNGFITSVKRKGLYCVKFTRRDLLNLMDLRVVLESLSFEKCVSMASQEDIAGFQRTIDDFWREFDTIMSHDENSIGKELALLHNDLDVRFHVGIARISDSLRLVQYITEIESMLLIARQRIYRSSERVEIVQLSWKQHEEMLEAIRAWNKDAARALLDKHCELMRQTQININEFDEIVEYAVELGSRDG